MTDRLRRLLGGPDLCWLLDRLRRRLEQGRPLTGPVTLAAPTAEQRQAVERLLGRRPGRGASLTFDLDDLDAQLRRSGLHPDGLRGAAAVLLGEVVSTAAARAATADAWATACAVLVTATADSGPLRTWYADPGTTALIRRLGATPALAAPMLADLARVLAALPATGVPLGRFAADTTGRPHALDHGEPLATLALSAIRSAWAPGLTDATGAQRRRRLWAAVGVYADELSSTVLTLNIPVTPGSPLARLTDLAGATGEPLVLTLRQLVRQPFTTAGRLLFVCENPAVVAAAADELGPDCPPLVCVNGQPSIATRTLLDAFHRDGADVTYHGDFDWGGIRIANLLHARLHWRPWRFDTAAYRSMIHSGRIGGPLTGEPVDAAWDPHLREALELDGHRVEEELTLPTLLDDLRTASTAGRLPGRAP